ncbi:cytoplasmic dynein 2 intermediate chain 1-like isoform X2 [Gigantopelta aegis]|uniref:cytoplasmic dynein 2 intermediate chain 1-like isoform X2 n=1 Tax=Gigantopelta aegis TaxID=1735272 RepID=UPI001B8873F8|nr:cytoplasmic dynein 2 intermediate chain 1-like isoform X2 [Gigantopelta aegis]
MPSGKGNRDDLERKRHRRDADEKHRHHDDDEGRDRRRRKDELNGHDARRRPPVDDEKKTPQKESTNDGRRRRNFSPEPDVHITEEERERQRRERREKRERKEGKTDDKRRPKKEEKPLIINDDGGDYDRRRRDKDNGDNRKHRDRREDEVRRADDEDDYRKRHRDDDHRRHRDDENDRRDKHRREKDKESKHKKENGVEEKRERRKDERRDKDRDRQRDRDRDEQKDRDRDKHRDRERDERKDRDRDRHRDRERDERKDRDRDRHRDRERDEQKDKDQDRHKRKDKDERRSSIKADDEQRSTEKSGNRRTNLEQKAPAPNKPDTDSEPDEEEPYYEDDFEDYEEDFEEDEDEAGKKEGEMDEVLKALDEENNRLQVESHRSNWSDSTELSDERFRDTPPNASRSHTFINFVSAKERVLSHTMASKTRRRAEDLASMIELDTVAYDMFDMHPVKEYELYIRSFGRSNTKQVYVQTNEDNLDHEAQTDDVDTKDKWTQNPAEDLVDCGGDGIDSEDVRKDISSGKHVEIARLGMFLERASQTIGILLEEELESQEGGNLLNTQSCIAVSDGYSQLGTSKVLQGRHVVCACFCPSQPDMLLTMHSTPTENSASTPESRFGVLCVWNVGELSSPQKILGCNSQPTCCCFSPSKATLAFSGMVDGSVAVWDLREPVSMHRAVKTESGPVRFPTFNTAGIAETDNHHSPVVSITPVFSVMASSQKNENVNDVSTGLSFQLATLEENGIVCLWVIAEISNPDAAGSEHDLGLAPGGRIKLLKSSSITIENPRKEIRVKTSLHTSELQLMPSDLNHFYVATDCGSIVHGVRFGTRVFPRAYSTVTESPVTVTSIDISPFTTSYIIAGCDDGSLHIYHTKLQNPLISLVEFSQEKPILCVRWSRSRPAVFYVLDSQSKLYVFDIIEHSSVPVQTNTITSGRVVSMCLSNDPKVTGLGSVSRPPQMLLSFDDGRTEIHTIKKELSEPQTLEEEFLEKYVDKF